MKNQFEVAAGSIIGKDHKIINKNNQDAFEYQIFDDYIIAVVCDGVSNSPYSEVGSNLAASILVNSIQARLKYKVPKNMFDWEVFLNTIKEKLLNRIHLFAQDMGYDRSHYPKYVIDHFLFTILGTIITKDQTIVFSIGDGVYSINNRINSIESKENNTPNCISYSLISQTLDPKFVINEIIDTKDLDYVLIGTDGLNYLKNVMDITEFYTDDSYFLNPDKIRRKLNIINTEKTKINWKDRIIEKTIAPLKDDTTLIIIRRKI